MQRPSHHLDLCLVPADADREAPRSVDVFDNLARSGFTDPGGSAGHAANDLVNGGFARVRLDDPGGMALYANGQGGFRVFCPRCGVNLTAAWSARPRDPATLVACACGAEARMDALEYRPPAAFGRWALVIADAEDGRLTDRGLAAMRELLGDVKIIGRRVVR